MPEFFSEFWPLWRTFIALSYGAAMIPVAAGNEGMSMSQPSLPEEPILLQALEIESPADRAVYLDRACGADTQLRAGVEALLRASAKSGDLLDLPDRPDTVGYALAIDRHPLEIAEGKGMRVCK